MKKYLLRLIEGDILSQEDTHNIMLNIISEQYNEHQIAALLMALQTRGVSVDELLGFRQALLETGDLFGIRDCRCRLQGEQARKRRLIVG